jgi:hypothetical protein
MSKIVFKNEETAKLFETDSEVDAMLEIGCECNGGNGWKGKLSDIPPMAAMELANQNYLVRQKQPPAKPAKASLN